MSDDQFSVNPSPCLPDPGCFCYYQDRLSVIKGKVDKTRQVLEGEIQRRQQMKKDLETIRMWFVKIEVLINSKLAKHEEMDEREMKVNDKPKQGTEIKKQIDILTD